VVVSGLATGSIYALVALSLVIIYNATHTVNFAQGDMLDVSPLVAWSATRVSGCRCRSRLGCAVGAGALLGLLVERAIIRRAISATHWTCSSPLGLSLVLRRGRDRVDQRRVAFPALSRTAGEPRPVRVGAGLARHHRRLARPHARAHGVLSRHAAGRAMPRGWPQKPDAARLMGISVERVHAAAWVLASVVGAIAGVLIAPVTFLSPRWAHRINGFNGRRARRLRLDAGRRPRRMLLGVIENLAPLYLRRASATRCPSFVLIGILLCARAASGTRRAAEGLGASAARRARDGGGGGAGVAARGAKYFVFLAHARRVNAVVAIGLNLLSGYTNQLSFGHAGFLAVAPTWRRS